MLTCLRGPQGKLVLPIGSPSQNKEFTYLLTYLLTSKTSSGGALGKTWNGMEWNGLEWNGMEWIGMEWNGMDWNGLEWNGMEWIGMEWNGMEF